MTRYTVATLDTHNERRLYIVRAASRLDAHKAARRLHAQDTGVMACDVWATDKTLNPTSRDWERNGVVRR